MNAQAPGRLARLLGFLKVDPQNLSLLADAAGAALDEGELITAMEMFDHYAAITPLPPHMLNLRGVALIAAQDFPAAAMVFEDLLAGGTDNPALRFNLAWCRAVMTDYAGALALLDNGAVAASPRAAALKIEMMHHLEMLEDALACGLGLAELYPDDAALMGALANVAMDAEELELARHYAERAGDRHEGLAALGMLMLNEEQVEGAMKFFDRALERRPDDARALLGKGLGLLAAGESAPAAEWLDRGAEVFGSHVGSWIAAGWAHLVAGDRAAARQRFERALALDDTFSESQGAVAVMDILDGEIDSARRRTEIALRLDRRCFSAALAMSLLAASQGDPVGAERVLQTALNTPIGPDGKTIAQAMANMNLNAGTRARPAP